MRGPDYRRKLTGILERWRPGRGAALFRLIHAPVSAGMFWCVLQMLQGLRFQGGLGALAEFAGSVIGGAALWGWWAVLTVCGMNRWRGIALWTLAMLVICWLTMAAVLSIDVASGEFWSGLGHAWNAIAAGRSAYSVPWIGPLMVLGSFAMMVLAAPGVVPIADRMGRALEADARGRARSGAVAFWMAWAAGLNALPLVVSMVRGMALRSGSTPSLAFLLPAVALVWVPLSLAFAVKVLPDALGAVEWCVRGLRLLTRAETAGAVVPAMSGEQPATSASGTVAEPGNAPPSPPLPAEPDDQPHETERMAVARHIAELYRSMGLQPRLAARRQVKARFLAELLAVGGDGAGALRIACLTEAETSALMDMRSRTVAAIGEADAAEPRPAVIANWRTRLTDDPVLASFMQGLRIVEEEPAVMDETGQAGVLRVAEDAGPAPGAGGEGDVAPAGTVKTAGKAEDAAAEAWLGKGMAVFPALARAVDGWTRDLEGLARIDEAALAADRALAVLEGREAVASARGSEAILEHLRAFLHEVERLPAGHEGRRLWTMNAVAALDLELGLVKALRQEADAVGQILGLSPEADLDGEDGRLLHRNRSALEVMARLGGRLGDVARKIVTRMAEAGPEAMLEASAPDAGAEASADRPMALDLEGARRLTERLAAQGQWDSTYQDLELRRRTVERTRMLATAAVRDDDGLRYRQGMLTEVDGMVVPVHAVIDAAAPDGKVVRSLMITGVDALRGLPDDGEVGVRFDESDQNLVIGVVREGIFTPVREIEGFVGAASVKAAEARTKGQSGWLGVMILYGVMTTRAVHADMGWIRKVVQRFGGDVAVLTEDGATPETLRDLVLAPMIDAEMVRRRCFGELEMEDDAA